MMTLGAEAPPTPSRKISGADGQNFLLRRILRRGRVRRVRERPSKRRLHSRVDRARLRGTERARIRERRAAIGEIRDLRRVEERPISVVAIIQQVLNTEIELRRCW